MKSYKITVNGQSYDVTVEEVGATTPASPAPQAAAPRPAPPRTAGPSPVALSGAAGSSGSGQGAAGATVIKAPMPGTLLSFKAARGAAVKKGDIVLILEAMKMENEIASPVDGVVSSLSVGEGASVSTGDPLMEITP
jgi:glutaconyl-CoA decarboxylase